MKRAILGFALVVIGILLALRPLDWIESRYGVDPDADSGALELIISTVLVGAGVTAVLFSLGKLVIGLYIGKSGIVSGFGAAASIVVLLIWVYYSAQIFLLGAEFTYLYAHTYGSLRDCEMADKRAARDQQPPATNPVAAGLAD